MPQIHHRAGGAVVAGLLSDAYAEIICDGFHLAPETVRLVNRVKDPAKVILITDSMEGAGCPDGLFHIAGRDVFVKDGKAYTADGTISGSTLNLFDGVKNYAAFSGIPVAKAINAATVNPATMLGLEKVGAIKADLVRSLSGGVVTIGNGFNDVAMSEAADLSLCVLGPEGCCGKLVGACDILVRSIPDALDLLLKPDRIRATLRT